MNHTNLVLGGIALFFIFGAFLAFRNPATPAASDQHADPIAAADVRAQPEAVGTPIARDRKGGETKTVKFDLKATQIVGTLADGTTYEYWTYDNQVPGPFLRVMEGDTVEISLTHEHAHAAGHASDDPFSDFVIEPFASIAFADEGHTGEHEMADGHMMTAEQMEHMAAGHGEHSIDLHSVLGPGGGAEFTRVGPNETKTFSFKAMRPGIYVYHCASPHVPSHIANGMYGLILVEPEGGLAPVDKEFYVVQGEFYTTGKLGEQGHQALDKEKLLAERPEYFVFNGRKGALTGEGALRAKVGDKVRIFFGVSGQLPSNLHLIGGIFDRVFPEGDIVSAPHKNVQTTLVPGGGAAMVEFMAEVPGKFLLVDHALTRAIDRGAVGELIVEGAPQPDIISAK